MKMRTVASGPAGLLGLTISSREAVPPAVGGPLASVATSPSATTIYATWTPGSPSVTRLECGITLGAYNITAVDNDIQTNVKSHLSIVADLLPSTIYHRRTSSGSSQVFTVTTFAIPHSTPLVSFTRGTPSNPVPNQNNGDTFFNAVSADGVPYVATDDTRKGWNVHGTCGNMAIGRFISISPFTRATMNPITNFGLINETKSSPRAFHGLVPWQGSVAGASPNGTPFILFMAGNYRSEEAYQPLTAPMTAIAKGRQTDRPTAPAEKPS
jgi:hypothetical protein